ncbi:uncharacterized protein LOC111124444 [Crassostrea virginica]
MRYQNVVTILASLLAVGEPHGYMIDPPQRSSMWRVYPGFTPNYNDMELYCGGRERQWNELGGKCGTCGDPYDAEVPENEAGGKYATGIIGRNYTRGQIIKVKVVLTANHVGDFQFKLCPHNNPNERVSPQCLDQHVLTLAGTNEHRYLVSSMQWEHEIDLQLPPEVVCTQCVLQWTYTTGNSPGYPPEMFVNCADVAIVGDVSSVAEPFTSSPLESPNTSGTLTTTIGDSKGCSNGVLMCHGTPPDDVTEERFCNEHCRKGTSSCTTKRCYCQCENITCKAIGAFDGQTSVDAWCTTICTLTSDLCSTANRDRCRCV